MECYRCLGLIWYDGIRQFYIAAPGIGRSRWGRLSRRHVAVTPSRVLGSRRQIAGLLRRDGVRERGAVSWIFFSDAVFKIEFPCYFKMFFRKKECFIFPYCFSRGEENRVLSFRANSRPPVRSLERTTRLSYVQAFSVMRRGKQRVYYRTSF